MSTDIAAADDLQEEQVHRLNLNVDVENAGPCLKHIRVTIPRADIEHYYDNAVTEFSGSASVPGFRVGRVPKGLVQRRFRSELTDQVKQRLLVDSLEQVAEDNALDPINEPNLDIAALEIPEEGDFEYEFDVEVRPEFDLPDYAGIEVERPKMTVTDEQVAAYLERFLSQYGQLVPHEGTAELGDNLTLSAVFTRDGNKLHEIDEFTARLRPVLRFRDAELDNFGELFVGASIDDKREANVTVSSEAESVELRGEQVHVAFELLDLKRLERPSLDKELLDRIGVESEEELRTNVRQTLERQAVYQERQHARAQVIKKITASADWELPEKLVSRQVENALRREVLEMQQAGFTTADIRARENQIRQNALTNTRQALKEHFVLDRIATKEEIEVSQHDLEQEIHLMASQQGESPRRLRAQLLKSGMIENLEAQLRERKAIDFVLGKATFVEVESKPSEAPDRIEAVPQSVCGGVILAAEAADDENEDGEE